MQNNLKPQIDTDEHRLNDLTFAINGCAMEVLNQIGHGFNEKVYEKAMTILLKERGIGFCQQRQFEIIFKNQNIGTFIPDLVIENQIIVELKTIEKIGRNEIGQVMNYLRASSLKYAIILNFKHAKLEWKRIAL